MLEFKPIAADSIGLLKTFFDKYPQHLCEYTSLEKVMWQGRFSSKYCVVDDTLFIIENYERGKYCFHLPVGPDISKGLDILEAYALKRSIRLVFAAIPLEYKEIFLTRYPHAFCIYERRWSDYLYYGKDLIEFAGKEYAKQRNHIAKFIKTYPNWEFRQASEQDIPDIENFYESYERQLEEDHNPEKAYEAISAYHMISLFPRTDWKCGYLKVDGKIVAFEIGEISGDTLFEHIEKADKKVEGAYTMIVQQFIKCFIGKAVYVNREDDAGDMGLRISKLRYRPCAILEKNFISVKSDVDIIKDFPVFSSLRLHFSKIRPEDKEDYCKMSIDEDLNQYWGYDYKKDLGDNKPTPEYFYQMCLNDFASKECFSFICIAKQTGKMIGECVLYNFDSYGNAEIGVRIIKEYQHAGFGREAIEAVSLFARHVLHIKKVMICAYKENMASEKMIESLGAIKVYDTPQRNYYAMPK